MRLFIKRLGVIAIAGAVLFPVVNFFTDTTDAETSDEIRQKLDNSNQELSDLENQLYSLNTEINDLDAKASNLIQDLFNTQTSLSEKEDELSVQYSDMKTRIQYMYENSNKNLLETLYTSASFADALNSAEYYQRIYSYDRDKLESIKETKQEIEKLNNQLEKELAEVEDSKELMNQKQNEMSELIASKSGEISQLDSELAQQIIAEEAERQKAAEEAARQQQEAEAAAAAAAEQQRVAEASKKSNESNKNTTTNSSVIDSNSSNSNTDNNSSKKEDAGSSSYSGMGAKVASYARQGISTFPCTAGWCAAWVSGVYSAAGVSPPRGNAIDYWLKWGDSGSTSMSNIPVGACVISSGWGSAGAQYGHIGIYLGGGMVASNVGYLKIQSISSFDSDATATCKGYQGYIGWVWPNGVALD